MAYSFGKRPITAIASVEYLLLPSVQCSHPIYRHHAGTKCTKHGPVDKQVCPVYAENYVHKESHCAHSHPSPGLNGHAVKPVTCCIR